MKELTQKQRKILSYIESCVRKEAQPPTFQQIQAHFGFASPRAATKHVQALVKKGFLGVRKGGKKGAHRGLIPLRPPEHEVPLVGRIAAGTPIEALENVTARLDLRSLNINNADASHFALLVKGDSMINDHIQDGDIVVIRRQPDVEAADIAAVLLNNEATLKHVKRNGASILLIPANDRLKPVEVRPDTAPDFRILGKVVRSIRTY